MKKKQKEFGSMVDVRQILIGLPVGLFGYLVYLIFPPLDQTHISHKNPIKIIIHNALPNFFEQIANSLLFLIQMFSFILTKAGRLFYQKIAALIISVYCFLSGCILKSGKIINSSFLKRIHRRNIFTFNRVPIFAIFIVFISIFSFNVNYLYSLNTIYNDDCLICDTGYDGIDDVSNLSVYDVYRVPSNDLLIVIVPIKNVFINPYDLTFKISTRSPPA